MQEPVVDLFRRWESDSTEEGLHLEFKSGKLLDYDKTDAKKENASRHNLAKAVASLANTEGGRVGVGIAEDKGGSRIRAGRGYRAGACTLDARTLA